MAGLSVAISGQEVQTQLGQVAKDLHMAFRRIEWGADFLAANSDADLTALYGLTAGDIAALRAAYDDLEQLRRIYRGQDALPAAKNFRTTVRKIIGHGMG